MSCVPRFLANALAVFAIVLLAFNEARFVLRGNQIDGPTTLVQGELTADAPAADPLVGPFPGAAYLRRTVEMYQRSESTRGTDPHVWSRRVLESDQAPVPRMPLDTMTFHATGLRIGQYVVWAEPGPYERVPLTDELAARLAAAVPGARPVADREWIRLDPRPVPGSLRVKYEVIPLGEYSIAGVADGSVLKPVAGARGRHSAEALLGRAATENQTTLWLLRFFGGGLLLAAIVFRRR